MKIVKDIAKKIEEFLAKNKKNKTSGINPNELGNIKNKEKTLNNLKLNGFNKLNKKKIIKLVIGFIVLLVLLLSSFIGWQYYQSTKNDNIINDIVMPSIKKINHNKVKTTLKRIKPPSKLIQHKKNNIKKDDKLLNSTMLINNSPIKQKISTNKPIINKTLKISKKNIQKNDLILKNNSNLNLKKVKINKSYTEAQIFNEIKKPEKLLSNNYLPILSKEKKGKKDIYALTNEELIKLDQMDSFLNKKQNYMEKVSKYLDKKQKYLTALKTFDDFNKQIKKEQQIKAEKTLRTEMNEKFNHLEKLFSNKFKTIKTNITNLKKSEVTTVVDNKQVNIQQKEIKTLNQKNIGEFFKKGQIFSMNNEYIIAIDDNGLETVYKTNDIVLNGFIITNITSTIVTLEKDNKIYFYNLKNRIHNQSFDKIVIKMPAMFDNFKEKKVTNNKSKNNEVKKYQTPEERQKAKAKRFFNLKN